MTAPGRSTVLPRLRLYPIARLIAALLLMTMGGAAMYATIMTVQPVSREFTVSRGVASLPYMLFMVGFGLGGVVMGRVADRFGILVPLGLAVLALPAGFHGAAQAETLWQFCLAMGLLAGFCGAAATFGPLVADISHWFSKHRGAAVGIVISGTYVAGALWPPILQSHFDAVGWRATFEGFALFTVLVMLPLVALLVRRAPAEASVAVSAGLRARQRPLGLAPGSLQCLICAAGVGCCAAMAMPQVHIVPYASDLGYAAAQGAQMLSLMLFFGIVSRLYSGWISDRIGGLKTLFLGSLLQMLVLAAFLGSHSLTGLYLLSIAFGLSQGGIVPSYAIIIRTYFPPGEAGWRIGGALLFTIIGMALGGWMAGALYDLTGSYDLAFLNAIAFNVLNLAIAGLLLQRARAAQPA